MSLAPYATRAIPSMTALRCLGEPDRAPSQGSSHNPVSHAERPGQRGCFRSISVYQKRRHRTVLRGPRSRPPSPRSRPRSRSARSRARRSSGPRYRTRVAHAGPSTSTCTRRRARNARARAPRRRARRPPATRRRPRRSAPSGGKPSWRADRLRARRAADTARRSCHAVDTPRCARRGSATDVPARRRGGIRPAVVSSVCPGGRLRTNAAARVASSSLKTSSSSNTGRRARQACDDVVAGEPQRERERALLALRRLVARVEPVDRQVPVVAVRADEREATIDLGPAARGEGVAQASSTSSASAASTGPSAHSAS